MEYPCHRPGRPGAAEPFEPRQGRKTATVRKRHRVPPVACLDNLHANPAIAPFQMPLSRTIKLLLMLAIGLAFGLLYGWAIAPVEYSDAAPNILRADYRADYILMVAEAYRSERDADLAARRLAILGSEPPAQIVNEGITYARGQGFSSGEIDLLQNLLSTMQTYQPVSGDAAP